MQTTTTTTRPTAGTRRCGLASGSAATSASCSSELLTLQPDDRGRSVAFCSSDVAAWLVGYTASGAATLTVAVSA